MKPTLRLLTVGLLFVTGGAGFAQGVLVHDNHIWVVNAGRVNDPDYSGFLMHADSFSLSANALINQVSWLGTYKYGGTELPGDDNFTISLFGCQANTPELTPFASFVVGAERHVTSQTLWNGGPVYSYSARFQDMPLVPGNYLLAIMNDYDGNTLWCWSDQDAYPGQSYSRWQDEPWKEFSGNGVAEFAFSISYIPEPSGAVLLLFGGLFLRIFHLRRCSKSG